MDTKRTFPVHARLSEQVFERIKARAAEEKRPVANLISYLLDEVMRDWREKPAEGARP